uniref:Uncharacterized protein n=1 Tax=Anaerobacillus isosaccharinicus TaxID=1532552 RepID=A0A1S2M8Z0_9BACI
MFDPSKQSEFWGRKTIMAAINGFLPILEKSTMIKYYFIKGIQITTHTFILAFMIFGQGEKKQRKQFLRIWWMR